MKKEVLCIIPARKNSQGIKNKNIKKIGNKPLIYYSIQFAKKLNFVDKIVFSTDSKKYMTIANKFYDFDKKLRPARLAKNNSKSVDMAIYEILRQKEKYKYLLLLQPTSPFRKIEDFKNAYKFLKSNIYDTIITVKKVKEHPILMHKIKNKNLYPYLKKKQNLFNRQEYPNLYYRAGSMYFTKVDTVLKNKSYFGKKIKPILVKDKYEVNIDEPIDFVNAEHYLEK